MFSSSARRPEPTESRWAPGERGNNVSNGYENQQVGFATGATDCLLVFALRRELRTPGGFSDLSGRHHLCTAGDSVKGIFLGGGVRCDCRSFQSALACGQDL